MMPTISANLIVLNEQSHITDCLRSVAWADEIVVVDGGSADDTVRLARQQSARVLVHRFDDFASQRNRALDASRGDWVVSLDADERVSTALRDEIRETVAAATCGIAGYWVPIASHIFGRRFRWTGMQRECKMRLFRRECGRWSRRVHEVVRLRGQLGRLERAIEHYSTPNLTVYRAKLDRYARLEAEGLPVRRRTGWGRALWDAASTFGRLYVAKLGVLDGPVGLQFSALSAWERWVIRRQLAGPVCGTGGDAT